MLGAGAAGQPEYMGTAAISDGDYVHVAISHADLIIMMGHDVVEKPPFFMHPKDTRKVQSIASFVLAPDLNVQCPYAILSISRHSPEVAGPA